MNEPMQSAIPAVEGAKPILDQLRNLLTDQVWIVIGLVALGMVFGIATAGAARLFRWSLDKSLPNSEYNRRSDILKRIAFGFGTAWTFLILLAFIVGGVYVKVLLAVCLALVAGVGTPYMYDLLKWAIYTLAPAVGRWILAKVKTMLSGAKPPDPPAP